MAHGQGRAANRRLVSGQSTRERALRGICGPCKETLRTGRQIAGKRLTFAEVTGKVGSFTGPKTNRLLRGEADELLGHKTIGMTVRYSHLAPKHMLAAVERLDASTERSTDTTTDTGVLQRPAMQTAVLQ